jgi:hypothetical protein
MEGKDSSAEQFIKEIFMITNLNHDLNNQLTVISLSIRSIRKCGIKYEDEKLLKIAERLEDSLQEIEKTLTKLKPLKDNALIKKWKEEMQGTE